MEGKLLIKGAGILKAEIILTALQEYKTQCKIYGNHSRAEVVQDIIDSLVFDGND